MLINASKCLRIYICFVSISLYVCVYVHMIYTHTFISQPLTPIQHHTVDSSTHLMFVTPLYFSQRETSLIMYNIFTCLANPNIYILILEMLTHTSVKKQI